MILQKIEIEQFGGLKNYSLELSPGFQYLYGENEAGKSTICAFLSAMFYGFSKVRGGGLKGDGRKLYMPWGEKHMAGTVYFKSRDKEYVLKRTFGQTARGDRCLLLSAEDWTEIPVDPETLGQRFLGVGEDAFRKSLFISQLGAVFAKGKEDELMARLSNLEQTGAEDVSIQKAQTELERAEHELVTKTGRGGIMVQLEHEIETLKAEWMMAKQKNLSFRSLLENIQKLSGERDAALCQLADMEQKRTEAVAFNQYQLREKDRQQRKELENRLAVEEQALIEKQKSLKDLETEKGDLAGILTLESDILLQLAGKETACGVLLEKEKKRTDLLEETALLKEELGEKPGRSKTIGNGLVLGFSIVLLFFGVVLGLFLMPVFYVLIPLSVFVWVASFLTNRKQNQKECSVLEGRLKEREQMLFQMEAEDISGQLKSLQEEMKAVLEQAKVSNLSELSDKLDKVKKLQNQEEALQQEIVRLSENVNVLQETLNKMPILADESPCTYEGETLETLDQKLRQMQQEQMERERQLAQLTAKAEEGFSGTRGVSVIESQMESLRERQKELTEHYEAVRLAKSMLDSCAEELKSNFAPLLNEKSGELISKLTDGRYRQVKVTDDYSMMLKTPDGHEIIESDYVSAGTCDLLYFALRLAVLDSLYEEIPLLIMDDTFLQLDEKRQQAAFGLLKENVARQVLYFSCHKPHPSLDITVHNV